MAFRSVTGGPAPRKATAALRSRSVRSTTFALEVFVLTDSMPFSALALVS
jgi:hypothetical protein